MSSFPRRRPAMPKPPKVKVYKPPKVKPLRVSKLNRRLAEIAFGRKRGQL